MLLWLCFGALCHLLHCMSACESALSHHRALLLISQHKPRHLCALCCIELVPWSSVCRRHFFASLRHGNCSMPHVNCGFFFCFCQTLRSLQAALAGWWFITVGDWFNSRHPRDLPLPLWVVRYSQWFEPGGYVICFYVYGVCSSSDPKLSCLPP